MRDLVSDGLHRPFVEQGQVDATQDVDVSFCGNVWSAAVEAGSFSNDDFFSDLTAAVCRRKAEVPALSAWEILLEAIDQIETSERRSRGLTMSETPFWDYYLHAVWLAMNTHVRLRLLNNIPREVAIFGVFADPAPDDVSTLLAQSHDSLHAEDGRPWGPNYHIFEELWRQRPNGYRDPTRAALERPSS